MQSHGQPVRVSRELFDVLGLFDQWRVRTNGALDPSAQAVISAWTSAAAHQRVPTADELARRCAPCGSSTGSLNAADMTATHLSNAPLVLASFTKSYIIDRAVTAAMRVPGIHSVVLNVGGDIVVRGAVSEPSTSRIRRTMRRTATPISQIVVRDRAVATSGDYRRGVDIAGVHYSHIVDPRTGMPAGDVISSTVVAPNPADAGALATAFSILTPAESQRLAAATMPGVEYLLIDKNGRRIASPGWNRLEATRVRRGARLRSRGRPRVGTGAGGSPAAPPPQWDPTMELSINFEIPPLGGARCVHSSRSGSKTATSSRCGRSRSGTTRIGFSPRSRPGTARTGCAACRRTHRSSARSAPPRGRPASTRSSGTARTRPAISSKPGKYTVSLESSREHGTYQIDRQEMTFNGTPQLVEFKPGTELGVASFDYHKIVK